jgi:hypothetical protein
LLNWGSWGNSPERGKNSGKSIGNRNGKSETGKTKKNTLYSLHD